MWHHSNTFIILYTVKMIVKFPNHKTAYNVIKTLVKFNVRDLEKKYNAKMSTGIYFYNMSVIAEIKLP